MHTPLFFVNNNFVINCERSMPMSNREMNTSNKKKGDGNGNTVIDNHEYPKKNTTSSANTNDTKSVNKNKK